jgi:hypothetical protein
MRGTTSYFICLSVSLSVCLSIYRERRSQIGSAPSHYCTYIPMSCPHSYSYDIVVERQPQDLKDVSSNPGTGRNCFPKMNGGTVHAAPCLKEGCAQARAHTQLEPASY